MTTRAQANVCVCTNVVHDGSADHTSQLILHRPMYMRINVLPEISDPGQGSDQWHEVCDMIRV
jgi:hypothetical protein